jgi:hypothetical protein
MTSDMSNFTFHRETTVYYNEVGEQVVEHFDTYPSGPVAPREHFHCKYCYRTHDDWYQMKPEDYWRDRGKEQDVILCGFCGYTSLKNWARQESL